MRGRTPSLKMFVAQWPQTLEPKAETEGDRHIENDYWSGSLERSMDGSTDAWMDESINALIDQSIDGAKEI